MSQANQKPKVSVEDFGALGRRALHHWSKHRPKLAADLRRRGELLQAIKEAEDQAESYMESAESKGVSFLQAREIALALREG
ncbi:MAG: hypothetical protein IH617_04265 [Hydrogenophaga sp.]|nr:hypothetical protein [Hydrogenophaga sp.]